MTKSSLILQLALLAQSMTAQNNTFGYRSLKQISSAGDGVVFGIDAQDQIYAWTGTDWRHLEGELSQISAGSKTEVWGVNANHLVWKMTDSGWQRMPGTMAQVAVGKGGDVVAAIDLEGQPYLWNTTFWVPIPNSPALSRIALGPKGKVYGLGTAGEIYKFRSPPNVWTRIKGTLKEISVGIDGSIGGVTKTQEAYFRSDADVESEVAGSTAPPAWLVMEMPLGSIELLDVQTSMALDQQGLLVHHEVATPQIQGGLLEISSSLVVGQSLYEPAPDLIFNSNASYEPRQCAIPPGDSKVSVCLPTRLTGIGTLSSSAANSYNFKSSKFKAVPQVPQQTPSVTPSYLTLAFNTRGSNTSTSYVGRTVSSLSQAGPIVCSSRHFRSVSNHSWVEFRLPEGSQNQQITIPFGAYNNYVFPACNRVWWDNLTYSCDIASGWQLTRGAYNADALCHGALPASPYVTVGNR